MKTLKSNKPKSVEEHNIPVQSNTGMVSKDVNSCVFSTGYEVYILSCQPVLVMFIH